jgi:hypothetical protein
MLWVIFVIGGFLGALVFWAWVLQGLVQVAVDYWKGLGGFKRLALSTLLLFTLSLALEIILSFNRYFTII